MDGNLREARKHSRHDVYQTDRVWRVSGRRSMVPARSWVPARSPGSLAGNPPLRRGAAGDDRAARVRAPQEQPPARGRH